MDENIINIMEAIRRSYPEGMRTAKYDPTSVVYKYDYVRASLMKVLQDDIFNSFNGLFISKADENMLTEWEKFLNIEVVESDPLPTRRARILARMAGVPATITTLRRIIGEVTGDLDKIQFIETYKIFPTQTWNYDVIITMPTSNVVNFQQLDKIITTIEPYHCLHRLIKKWILNGDSETQKDNIGIQETEAPKLAPPLYWFRWADPNDPDITWDKYWADASARNDEDTLWKE